MDLDYAGNGLVDLTGGTVDALIGNLQVALGKAGTGTPVTAGTFSFSAGTVTAGSINLGWAPVVDGGWLVLGLLVLVWYRSQGREDWIRNAGNALGEGEEEYEKVVGGP